ncbi:MAG: hypothetical protein ACFE9L_13310 [Candidatus Hodarchaeota archaeon]
MPLLTLRGRILTPIITQKTSFWIDEHCFASILNPRRRYYNKITADKPMYPYSFTCYLGDLEVRFRGSSRTKVKKKLHTLLNIDSIGRFTTEGAGKVRWVSGSISKNGSHQKQRNFPLRIRKGLPHVLSTEVQALFRYGLLHDFVHTPHHRSKIYVELELADNNYKSYLAKHHERINDPFLKCFQKYDQQAAILTRKIRSPRTNRYTWASGESLNFNQLATEIQEVSDNIWKLYDYIYKSKELTQVTESLQYGHSSLRDHLLVLTNLIVRDAQVGHF